MEGFYKSKDPTSFSQEDASPPKVPWKLGSSRNGNLGSSVIAMLDTIVDDFGKEQQDADKAEEKAEEELAQARHTRYNVEENSEFKVTSVHSTS